MVQQTVGRWTSERARECAEALLSIAGPGRTLVAGHSAPAVSAALLAQGVDSLAVLRGEQPTLGRVLSDFPTGDRSFATVVIVCGPELSDADLHAAATLSMRNLVVFAEAPAAFSGAREAWDRRLLAKAWRRHPLAQRLTPYAALEHEPRELALAYERIPENAAATYDNAWLERERNLHMDMLREPGRRADAHAARYLLASWSVRPGDAVLDAACGLGYGSHILAHSSPVSRVLGVDLDPKVIDYARANFGSSICEFRPANAQELSDIPDRSFDLIASFETLEHVPDPAAVLREFERILTPGGRLIASVPNQWVDDHGRDPNPHHLHVYDWKKFAAQIGERFLVEKCYRQLAGGGMKFGDRPRRIDAVQFDATPGSAHDLAQPDTEAEWWVVVAMKSPIGATGDGYRDRSYPDHTVDAAYNVTSFARDYDNPWLFRSIVDTGVRCQNPALLRWLCGEVIATARPDSADYGSAACVLAHSLLSQVDPPDFSPAINALNRYIPGAPDTPHGWRWKISCQSVLAKLLLASGRRDEALAAFETCAAMDYTRFSPLLASKIIDAHHRAGVIHAADGRPDRARRHWKAGLEESRRALSGPWVNIWASPDRPLPWGMHDAAIVADLASRCSAGLTELDRFATAPAQAWIGSQRQTFSDSRDWIQRLLAARDWLEGQVTSQADHIRALREHLKGLEGWNGQQLEGITWLEQRAKALEQEITDRDRVIESYKAHVKTIEGARAWLEEMKANFEKTLAIQSSEISKLQEWNAELMRGLEWSRENAAQAVAHFESVIASKDAQFAELKRWADDLKAGNEWLAGQVRAWEAAAQGSRTLESENLPPNSEPSAPSPGLPSTTAASASPDPSEKGVVRVVGRDGKEPSSTAGGRTGASGR